MTNELKYSGWRRILDHYPPHHKGDIKEFNSEIFPVIPATRFFDQMSFIGNQFVGCFVIETNDGLVLLDCLETGDVYIDILENGLKDLGLDPRDIKAVLITHGHLDHYGRADRLRELYGTKLYMSKVDEDFARDPASPRAPGKDPMPFAVDGHLEDGQVFSHGGVDIQVYSTPGHTPGGLSFIVPVTDEGRPHKAALWGGTGVPRNPVDQQTYLASSRRFTEICREQGVDAEISTHPFVDLSEERLLVCRNIVNGVANPFVIGKEAAIRYHEMFTDLCLRRMKKD